MPLVSEAYPSRFLKGEDFQPGQKVRLTILDVKEETLTGGQGGGDEVKLVVSFRKTDKQLALNKTNALTIKGLYGDDTDDWIGGDIYLFAQEVTAFGQTKPAVRVLGQKPPAVGGKEPVKAKPVFEEENFSPEEEDDEPEQRNPDIPF